MAKEYDKIPVSKFDNVALEEKTNEDFENVFKQPIKKKCINLMLDYTENYIKMYRDHPEVERVKYIDTIIEDNEILKKVSQSPQRIFTVDELVEYGITICTIKTGLQRLWINHIKSIVRSIKHYKNSGDYKRYKLLPGQHLFYYGAFSGRLTRSMSPATHHFIYLYNGIIMEVGTEKIEGCRDIDPLARRPSISLLGQLKQYLYKGAMSYFGFSTIQSSVRWARDYGQDTFYVYTMHNDSDKTVINSRLTRASSSIGKWPYSLMGSNNCENAANYINVGESLSTQACALDTVTAITKALKIVPEIEYTRTHEYDLRSKAELPKCVRGDGAYVERYLTDKGQVCRGGLSRGFGIFKAMCNIDPRYCESCEETGPVTDTKTHKVCVDKKSARGFKILN